MEFKQVDDVLASAALKAMKGHMSYLTQDLMPLCLFSPAVDEETKAKIVVEMLKHPKADRLSQRHATDFGKPVLPEMPVEEIILLNFVGEDCWGFFRILKIDTSFLDSPVSN